MELAKGKWDLERLWLDGLPQIGPDSTWEDFSSKLPRLKHLSLLLRGQEKFEVALLPVDVFSHINPLQSLEYRGLYLDSAHTRALATHHGTTLHLLSLRLYPALVAGRRLTEIKKVRLTESYCPVLTELFNNLPVLRLSVMEIDSTLFTTLPSSLQILDVKLTSRKEREFEDNRRCLAMRCSELRYIRVYDRQHSDMNTSCGHSFAWHNAWNMPSLPNVATVSPRCLAYDCRNETVKWDHPCWKKILRSYAPSFRQPFLPRMDQNPPLTARVYSLFIPETAR